MTILNWPKEKKFVLRKECLDLFPCPLTRYDWQPIGMRFNGSNEKIIMEWIAKRPSCECHPFFMEAANGNIYFKWGDRTECLYPDNYIVLQTDGEHTVFSLYSEENFMSQFVVEDE
jgi:hypothetical protein